MSLREWQEQLGTLLLEPRPHAQGSFGKENNADALALYQELLFNTVCGTVETIYPLTRQVLTHHPADESHWRGVVESYRRACPNRSYSLIGAICDFPAFLEKQSDLMADFPFIADLALYEWLEMAVLNEPEPTLPAGLEPSLEPGVPEADLFTQYQPVWNPVRRLHRFSYQLPALLEAWKESPQSVLESPHSFQGPQDILIYRDPRSLDARFFVLNDLTAAFLRVSATGVSYASVLIALQSEIPALSPLPMDVLKGQARGLLEDCLDKGILLGSVAGSA